MGLASDRVRRHTAVDVLRRIDERTDDSLRAHADAHAVARRLAELDREWDIERVLQANASLLVLAGTLLGARVDRRFLILPAAVLSFFAQHALQGWCPPVPLFRRLGVRTAREIERERYAIKAMRGDFDAVPAPGQAAAGTRVRAALAAVDR